MKYFNNILFVVLALVLGLSVPSCKDLTELNENPNGVPEGKANADLILSTVLTDAAATYTHLGYQDAAGVMQHTQKDAWFSGHNNYDWGPRDWGNYYSMLRNNQTVYEKAVENEMAFHQGVSLVMKSFIYAQITDLWGDAPYSDALKGNLGGAENISPTYDTQKAIYQGIIADLKEADQLLSKGKNSYPEIFAETEKADIIYNGDPAKWQKFANSLLLRYLMRVSEKMDVQSEFVNIVQSQPIFESNEDHALMNFPGSNERSAWPNNTVFDGTDGSNFRRIRPAETLVEALRERNDPRMGVWFANVEVPTRISDEYPHNEIVDGVRYLHADQVDESQVNTNPDYVGVPTQMTTPSGYNLNPTPGQTSNNRFVSYLHDRYRNASGPLLNARLMTYAELNFILAEAAHKGWLADAEGYYNAGVRASLEEWGVGEHAETYLSRVNVTYDGTLERIMRQKWIASWTAAQEAWFDYRRTGLPAMETGPAAPREGLPLRFQYGSNELNFNPQNVNEAIERLVSTAFSQGEVNSQWDKTWILAGTDEPY
ncbi:SusD/RagB family nutrient-binding outer membrane lipoprotein [Fodinibius sediminis]|uniref:Starch-binding associating with outer membrane n=1 Tax=Fodinibius sediminis TaxID=1214077 RepID=A0A521BUA2_9BACT|nr:SusD/RagB family nutrient-binding outer membrane lipoprotein [Fodinibius sediminis]SMO50655.1 Starch-binding associating with outer membrane [Fodinibius sediminis]